jgi:hypothetical protein
VKAATIGICVLADYSVGLKGRQHPSMTIFVLPLAYTLNLSIIEFSRVSKFFLTKMIMHVCFLYLTYLA